MVETVQRSFTGGEISPSLRSRADLGKYTSGLALCENMFVRAQGGVYSRPGLRYIGEVGDSSTSVRLIPFSFNTEQNYVLVFQDLTMRVIKDGAFIESFELVTPYTEAELSRLKYTQDADVMTLVHPNHPPADLNRYADDSWALVDVNFEIDRRLPSFDTLIISTVTGIASRTSDTIEFDLTAHGYSVGDDLFFDDWSPAIGSIGAALNDKVFSIIEVTTNTFTINLYNFGLTDTGFYSDVYHYALNTVGTGTGATVRNYFYIITAIGEDGVESSRSANGMVRGVENLSSEFGVVMGIVEAQFLISDTNFYRVYKSIDTPNRYGWIGDVEYKGADITNFTDFNIEPDYSDAPPTPREPFNDSSNYPSITTYYQQRKIYGNTTNQPQTIFTSRTGYYDDFRVSNPLRDDDAITFTIASNQVNEIRHAVSLDGLVLLTSRAGFNISEGQDQVLTPYTVGARLQNYSGASWVEPALVNDSVVYVQEKGNRIRDLMNNVGDNIYQGNDLSIMAEHLFEDYQITEMSYADEPYGILWCVRDDGALLGMTYNRNQNVWAWHQHNTDGLFESVTTIGEDDRDATYFVVNRTIDGQTKRYIERLEKRITNDVEDCFYVDSGLSYDDVPADTFSGLDHLEGKTVVVLADGVVIKDKVVESGSITLDDEYSKVHIGLPYTPKVEMLQIDIPSMQQSLKGKRVNIPTLYIEIEKSRGLFAGVKGEEMMEVIPREVSYDYSAPPLNSWVETMSIQPRWNDGREVGSSNIVCEQRDPLPLGILSVTAEVDISG